MIDRMQGTVRFSVTCDVTAAWQPGRDITREYASERIEFVYRDSRPFEVEMHILDGRADYWVFDRDIIFEGVETRHGIGDVQVYNDGDEFCYMRLNSHTGWCVLRFRLSQMREFAHQMERVVPRGGECVDMDLMIAKIFKKEAQ